MTLRSRRSLLWVSGLFVLGLWLGNSSLLVASHAGRTKLLAHRGVHQHFDPKGMRGDDCAAKRIGPPTHDLLENTLPSIAAAFAAGADVVELDVHLTPDDALAVFHDWTLDCVTEAHGVTHESHRADRSGRCCWLQSGVSGRGRVDVLG